MATSRFRGTFRHTIDDRGRIAVPARYRPRFMVTDDPDELRGVLIRNPHADGSLWLYPVPDFEQMAEQFGRPDELDPAAVEIQELIYGESYDVELDRQGRILIEQALRDEVPALQGPAVVVGMGARLEIWPAEAWEARRAERKTSFADLLGASQAAEPAS